MKNLQLEIENMVGEVVQDKDTYSWIVYKVDTKDDAVLLISENEKPRNTKLKLFSLNDFVHTHYKYRYNENKAIVMKKIIDIIT